VDGQGMQKAAPPHPWIFHYYYNSSLCLISFPSAPPNALGFSIAALFFLFVPLVIAIVVVVAEFARSAHEISIYCEAGGWEIHRGKFPGNSLTAEQLNR